jgi:hypothetical protein
MEALERESDSFGFIENLSALADRLAPLEGVKQVVLLSERRSGKDGEGPVISRAKRLHARYRAAGVILNGVDLRAPFVPGVDASARTPSVGAMAACFRPASLPLALVLARHVCSAPHPGRNRLPPSSGSTRRRRRRFASSRERSAADGRALPQVVRPDRRRSPTKVSSLPTRS